ncbi:MAG: TIGR03767 family metallophosphoesterase, partial [Actinomycetes bacterium]
MAGLSRRAFMATTAALAGTVMVPTELLGRALAAPAAPPTAPSTLLQTIRQSQTANKKYRVLVNAPGEPYLPRPDLLGKAPSPARTAKRRSLAYLGHFSDIHIIDAQSPGRLEPLIALTPQFIDASRPQDVLTTQVLAQMVSSLAVSRRSPLTGAPMAAMLTTGDTADSRNSLELEWAIKILDGGSLVPNSGKAGVYQGVQVWDEATYVYQPGNPDNSDYGPYGFPRIPGMLDAGVSQTVNSVGSPVPWYTTYGNHDVLFMGNIQVQPALQAWAVGSRKAALWPSATTDLVNWWATEGSVFQQLVNQIRQGLGFATGIHDVTPDSGRKLFDQKEFMEANLASPATPGPVGHGFTQANVDAMQTYWAADVSPYLRMFGLDTCNQVDGADGAVPKDQLDWLTAQLAQAQKDNKLAIIMSHHNSYTLENVAQPAVGPTQPLIHAEEFVATMQQYPNMIAWINGHTHSNTITAHPKPGGGGFWEITTASCVDFPQQQQTIEIIDNRDGTLSLFTTVLDHDSPAAWSEGDFSQKGFASLSRQLASNAWAFEPQNLMGSVLDRNCELLMPAPFDMTAISDAIV